MQEHAPRVAAAATDCGHGILGLTLSLELLCARHPPSGGWSAGALRPNIFEQRTQQRKLERWLSLMVVSDMEQQPCDCSMRADVRTMHCGGQRPHVSPIQLLGQMHVRSEMHTARIIRAPLCLCDSHAMGDSRRSRSIVLGLGLRTAFSGLCVCAWANRKGPANQVHCR